MPRGRPLGQPLSAPRRRKDIEHADFVLCVSLSSRLSDGLMSGWCGGVVVCCGIAVGASARSFNALQYCPMSGALFIYGN
jgi:hypothetical protein